MDYETDRGWWILTSLNDDLQQSLRELKYRFVRGLLPLHIRRKIVNIVYILNIINGDFGRPDLLGNICFVLWNTTVVFQLA